ncbi:MAG: glucose 1-dehydrogenase [Caldilineaceae bacterium]|nr:glucose 1-dehydrogenase [Caldilineaceae bacterium]
MMNFEGKVALVTGGASGIGRETARRFAELGASVVIADVDAGGGSDAAAEVRNCGAEGLFVRCDVSDPLQVARLFDESASRFDRLDAAINNAGIGGPWEQLQSYPHEGWDKVLAVNLTGLFYCMQEEIRRMIGKGGSIVNVASIAGKRGLPNQAAYTASKHAVIGLTRVSAQEVARHDIRVNAVCPAYTETPLIGPLIAGNPRRAEKMLERIPMRRFGKPRDIAEAIAWLCSDDSSFVTGQAINLDGGMTA